VKEGKTEMTYELLNNEFFERYRQMARVRLNPRRHTAANAKTHSDLAASVALALGKANGCTDAEQQLLEQLGFAHDIGKTTGTARPQRSVELLQEVGVEDEVFLRLVKWHDIALPWYNSARRGQAPSDKAWRRLASEADLRLLCMFMVADRSDAPGGWRRNKPTLWFLDEARRRGQVPPLVLDLDDRPSEISAGGAVVRSTPAGPEVLVIRVRKDRFELPKGGIEWDELPQDAAVREVREETGLRGRLDVVGLLGSLQYRLANEEGGSHLKLVRYFHLGTDNAEPGKPPSATRQLSWVSSAEVHSLPLVNEELRPLLRSALEAA
jgi:8-oxo-dGTP pyrophosphatase MutT (NUDIX family)